MYFLLVPCWSGYYIFHSKYALSKMENALVFAKQRLTIIPLGNRIVETFLTPLKRLLYNPTVNK